MTRRARLERLAAAILARMQAQAAARMDRHGRPQTNPYMTNVAHPAILTLYTQWKRSIDAGTYAVGDLDRIMFELSLLNDRAVAALEKEYAKELTTNDGLLEFNINSVYQVYDNFSIGLWLGYIANLMDSGTWQDGHAYLGDSYSKQDIGNVDLTFAYTF